MMDKFMLSEDISKEDWGTGPFGTRSSVVLLRTGDGGGGQLAVIGIKNRLIRHPEFSERTPSACEVEVEGRVSHFLPLSA